MSPHADTPDSPVMASFDHRPLPHANGCNNSTNGHTAKRRSRLRATDSEEVHDMLGIGFGPASLAIAVALNDAIEQGEHLKSSEPKVTFLERQPEFAWHAGMQIPGAKMQISFVKDLATLRDPRSEYTFLNYLHKMNRLTSFTNVGTFLPRRIEYEDYMRWCAGHFEDVVAYAEEVQDIRSIPGKGTQTVGSFEVKSRNSHSGRSSTRRAKNVVIAVGGRPKIPKNLPQNHPRVIHSSQYRVASAKLLPDRSKPYRIAVIGSGQSAAEIFNDLPSSFPNSKSFLLIKQAALRPSDDSPFVNEVFDPTRVDDIYSQDPNVRTTALAQDRSTNYGVVRLELLEHIYEELYTQRIKMPNEEDWPHRILTHRLVDSISDIPGDSAGRVRLHISNNSNDYYWSKTQAQETLDDVDLVIVGAGYERNVHEDMLQNVRHLMPGGDEQGKKWTVGRDYRVNFQDGTVSDDAGVWLQGCNEATHGVSWLSLLKHGEYANHELVE